MGSLTFELFKRQWLKEIDAASLSPTSKALAFGRKLFTQWRDLSESIEDLIEWPAPIDSAIDFCYVERYEEENDDQGSSVLYVIQSKYGIRSDEISSLLSDGEKAASSLLNLSSLTGDDPLNGVVSLLKARDQESPPFGVILVIATEDALTQTELSQLEHIRVVGRNLLGSSFEVEAISLETIYANAVDDSALFLLKTAVMLTGNLVNSGENILVGSVSLPNLFHFLKEYRKQTGDLDRLYEKNVRRFLGTRRRINRQMRETLLNDPAQFGLYNNGITLVVKDFEQEQSGYVLHEPYIVNGCQTTRTIWDIFALRYDARITNLITEKWRANADSGIVIVKVVRVGSSGENLLAKITRYTNSQNAVSEKDFITLDKGFQAFKHQMAVKYNVFLEIQRGGWDSQVAYQTQNPDAQQFVAHANAFDLLKVYGSGWLKEVGTAFARNLAFVPGGKIYKNIIEDDDNNFNVDDLYAAYNLENAADKSGFGRGAKKTTRRLTRFLFYYVVIELLRDVMVRNNIPISNKSITKALNDLESSQEAYRALIDGSTAAVDEYMTQGEEDSLFNEPSFVKEFNQNVNGYLKWNKLTLPTSSPRLLDLLAINKRTMGRGEPSPRDLIAEKIK